MARPARPPRPAPPVRPARPVRPPEAPARPVTLPPIHLSPQAKERVETKLKPFYDKNKDHSRRRNKLQPKRAADLVYVFSNSRMLKKVKTEGYTQAVVPWQNRWEGDEEEEDAAGEEGQAEGPTDSGDSREE
ncbi:hypothetical protein HXX76_006359 [Chlamydomonas incerta]|uniref:Uncharacterized protein n=1 Tax=Chlamydomonas incerta TaxID=51695 RepID=A0A835T102_CHLIN|nr:hypothetical protein HXX76_006359 [Chlamydomonas incerta]|eukprot:KAG2436838.1 hypothetical protein HXX76_006359 [Chlamydomonas incerta]